MKTLFTILFFSVSALLSAQTPPQFQANVQFIEPLFSPQDDSLKIRTLTMLSKIDVAEASVSLPSEYDWSRSLKRQQAAKYYALDFRQQDLKGRDIQRPMIEKLTTELYYKNLPTNFNANCHY